MIDLDTLVILTGALTNACSLVHTVQEMRDNPDRSIVENYRSHMSWVLGGGRNNPTYKTYVPRHLVAIPLSGPGVVLGTVGKRLTSYLKRNGGDA